MDLGATIVGIVIVGVCIIPFVLINRNSRKKKERLLTGLFGYAEKNNDKISRFDVWSNSTIGIDDTSRRIFFTGKVNETEIFQLIPLDEIQKCRLINSSRTVNHKDGNYKVIDKLELAFTYWEKGKPETVLEFYNRETDSLTLTGELQLTEKWNAIANESISAMLQRK